ncbi:hypothetical protein F4692_003465 [Nocardioides cavernae]|uniref:Imm-5-like domain-containing protein n=1 Tax=Nocardioides cavernae TaxID=1921566 RepID=A0A7Y9H5M6_9ACTN|nr:exonuclease SbcC [Nocardioides cavernae]NYE38317.1 hypothetical protein [Nocardioides cavernae]
MLPVFERAHPDDVRPRAALDAARVFVAGAARSRLQRVTSLDAHRAAREATDEAARLAARACGDAASAAYLHPIARATQVGHVLRATASEARIAELLAGEAAAAEVLASASSRAGAVVRDVLSRYPAAPAGRSRVARLMSELDASLR